MTGRVNQLLGTSYQSSWQEFKPRMCYISCWAKTYLVHPCLAWVALICWSPWKLRLATALPCWDRTWSQPRTLAQGWPAQTKNDSMWPKAPQCSYLLLENITCPLMSPDVPWCPLMPTSSPAGLMSHRATCPQNHVPISALLLTPPWHLHIQSSALIHHHTQQLSFGIEPIDVSSAWRLGIHVRSLWSKCFWVVKMNVVAITMGRLK